MKRFVIQFPSGRYSDGPRAQPTSLERAKMWKNIGHLKNHLIHTHTLYPKGTEIVELVVSHHEVSREDVFNMVNDMKKKKREKLDEVRKQRVKREYDEAARRLIQAKKELDALCDDSA